MVRSVDEFDNKKKTPYELFTDKKLKIAHMKIWGYKCWIHISKEQNTDKLNPWVIEGVFIGYTNYPT